MNTAAINILLQLTGVDTIEAAGTDSLGSIAETYPWFGPAHLLLAEKMKADGNNDTADLLRKTALYFSNPYWLNFLLTQEQPANTKNESSLKNIRGANEKSIKNVIINVKDEPEDYPPDEEENTLPDEINEAEQARLSGILQQQLSEFKKPIETEIELPIKATPLYTIDYFASQGIHIESIKAGRNKPDTLDIKVKKFTDWLKHMKSTNPQPTDLGTDAETEHMIETIAQNSNEAKDIITEAMAEVLIKQGKIEKAVQLYQKLSFLNPGKSVYFAAKIEKIKGN